MKRAWIGAVTVVAAAGCASAERSSTSGGGDVVYVDASSPVSEPMPDATVFPSRPDAGSTRPIDEPEPLDPEACKSLRAIVRDFDFAHPDFEDFTGDAAYLGLVASTLGADGTPTYLPSGGTPVTSGPERFYEWYHDVPGVNVPVEVELMLTEVSEASYVYASNAFFPVDGKGTNELHDGHNFAFTTQINTSFTYAGGERFTFVGDDDMWIFVNGRLAIDLGGPHPELSGTVDMDARAAELGLELGKRYPLDIFHAERHTPGSNFRIETSIQCFVPVL